VSTFRWTRRVALRVIVGAVVLLPLGGWLYERAAEARDARRFPPPGRLVDVGGRRLHLLCIGNGRPVVLFEASGFSNSASSSTARTSLAARTTVCSYDRAGVGWSDPSPATISVGELADDLKTLQDRAGMASPLLIVTSSMGGWVSEMFARRYPDRVAGLVFLDAGNSEVLATVNSRIDGWTWFELKTACATAGAAGRAGVIRLVDPYGFRRESSIQAERTAALMYGAQPWRAICAVVRGVARTVDEFAAAPPLRTDLPVVVLSAERTADLMPLGLPAYLAPRRIAALRVELRKANERLAHRSTRGSWQLVESGHLIASERPSVVVDAVLEMLDYLRGSATTAPHS
jgi:pimeloyl-ACP methyl ester carboxylesterase